MSFVKYKNQTKSFEKLKINLLKYTSSRQCKVRNKAKSLRRKKIVETEAMNNLK